MNQPRYETPPAVENPFFHRGPIQDRRYFFGRTTETRQALQMLRNGQCISIFGPRRVGKTSLLLHLRDSAVHKGHGLGEEHLFVYIDCLGIGNVDKSQVYQWLWEGTKKKLAERGEAGNWTKRASDFGEFREAMMKIRGLGYRPVFLLDEFETVAQYPRLDTSFFSALRSLIPTVVYATASQDPLYDLVYADRSVLTSPFFNVFGPIHLGFLSPQEAKEMVWGLLRMTGQQNLFTEKDLTFAFEVGGYWPFFLQLACYRLFQRKMERAESAAQDYESVRHRYAEDIEGHFRYAWNNLTADEREAVRLVCEGKVSQIGDEQRRRLARKCILYNNGVFSSVFAEFVQKQTDLGLASRFRVPRPPRAIAQKLPQPSKCELNITLSKHGWVSVRIAGPLWYEGESARPLNWRLADRLDRQVIDALRLEDWRFQVKEIGRELFEELILNRPEIAKGYQRVVGYVGQASLSLALSTPRALLRMPFEALHSEDEGYLCLRYPMYRVVSGCFFDREPLSAALLGQIDSKGGYPRALVVASNTWGPQSFPVPGVEEEARKVSILLREHGFEVCSLSTDEATEQRVRYELTEGDYLLFHYAGHGSYTLHSPEKSALCLWEGTKGESEIKEITALQLESLVQNTSLRFVYLSGCWGTHTASSANLLDDDFLGVMDGLVLGGVPAVLGFRWPVSDNGAQLLAQSFYSAWLRREKRLDEALCEARRIVADQLGRDERAWFSPILVMRALGY